MPPNVDYSKASFHALVGLLKAIIATPALYLEDKILLAALRSQGKLARYENSSLGIYPRSLNTLKRIAGAERNDGFAAFDRLRVSARSAVDEASRAPKERKRATKKSLHEEITALRKNILVLKEDLLLLTQAFEKSMLQARHYAAQAADPSVAKLCENQQKAILHGLNLRQTPFELQLVKNST